MQNWRIRTPMLVVSAVTSVFVASALGLWAQDDDLRTDYQLWVEALDETGAVVTDLVSPSLQVYKGGRPVGSVDQGEIGDGWRVVIYLDQLLATPTDFHNGTVQLAERARDLTALGAVEILLANRGVDVALPPTSSADGLEQALG
jgi:hypothetical protein